MKTKENIQKIFYIKKKNKYVFSIKISIYFPLIPKILRIDCIAQLYALSCVQSAYFKFTIKRSMHKISALSSYVFSKYIDLVMLNGNPICSVLSSISTFTPWCAMRLKDYAPTIVTRGIKPSASNEQPHITRNCLAYIIVHLSGH